MNYYVCCQIGVRINNIVTQIKGIYGKEGRGSGASKRCSRSVNREDEELRKAIRLWELRGGQ
jgi:hypothetical protein